MMIRYVRVFTPVLLAFVLACGTDAPDTPEVVLRDSAGITIVENHTPAWEQGEAWTVADSPVVDIGAVRGRPAYQLFRARSPRRLEDGRIAVANGGTEEVRFYNARGRYLSSMGGTGSGPGEFRALFRIFDYRGDSLAAYDGRLRRVSIFSDAEFVRSTLLKPSNIPNLGLRGVFQDGSFLVVSRLVSLPERGSERGSKMYLRYGPKGTLLDTLATLPGMVMYATGVSARAWGRQPFSPWTWAVVHRNRWYIGTAEDYEIAVYTREGPLTRLIRKDYEKRAVTPEIIEAYKQERLERAESANERRLVRRIIANAPYPETLPAYSRLLVDTEGNLWVKAYAAPGEERSRWSVFGPEGRWLGSVETPPGLRITQIGRNYVLGLSSNELRVQHVRLYELIKPKPGG